MQSSLFSKDITSDSSVDFNAIVENLNNGRDQSLTFQVDGEDYTVKLEGKNGVGIIRTRRLLLTPLIPSSPGSLAAGR